MPNLSKKANIVGCTLSLCSVFLPGLGFSDSAKKTLSEAALLDINSDEFKALVIEECDFNKDGRINIRADVNAGIITRDLAQAEARCETDKRTAQLREDTAQLDEDIALLKEIVRLLGEKKQD